MDSVTAAAIRQVPRIATSVWVQALSPARRYILRGGPDVMKAAGKPLGLTMSQMACRAATPQHASPGAPSHVHPSDRHPSDPQPSDLWSGELQMPQAASDTLSGGPTALWLGPDEQLLLAPEGFDLAAALKPALRDLPHSLVDVSHRQTAFQVSGPNATTLLNAGCPLDLDESAFPVGMCTRTVMVKAEIVLWRTSQTAFHVEVWRSFADYVSSFLAEVAREFGTQEIL